MKLYQCDTCEMLERIGSHIFLFYQQNLISWEEFAAAVDFINELENIHAAS